MTGIIAHEWIETDGGAERVLEGMVRTFPSAEIYCLWNDAPERFSTSRVTESALARSPLRGRKALALPWMHGVWKNARSSSDNPEWILTSSHLFAHHFGAESYLSVPKFAYVHTPARYIWAPEADERGASPVARAIAPLMKRIDYRAAQLTTEFAANSYFVRERIEAAWGRDARVIYPPVAVEELQAVVDWRSRLTSDELALIDRLPAQYVLGASRLVSYKRLGLVIESGNAVDLPVVIAGDGPAMPNLRARAEVSRVPVIFLGRVSDAMLRALYQRALVYVFPSVEDFGIMPVEAMSLGTPVVVNAVGGAAESVELLDGGFSTESFSRAALKAAVEEAVGKGMTSARAAASRYFGKQRFDEELANWVPGGRK